MKRINSVTDALNTNKVQVDVGDGIVIPLPADGVFAGREGPAGVGVPDGGSSGQVIQKTASGTRWATPSKELVGLTKVDNTADTEKPLSEPQAQALTNKADLIDGKVPNSQLPPITPVTDSTIAPLINGATTGAAIDARINTQVAPQVQKITADYIAGDRTVADAAAAAVNANPKIAELEAAKWLRPAMPGTADFNDYETTGMIPVPTSNGKTNIPFAFPGALHVDAAGSTVLQKYVTSETRPRSFERRRSGGVWEAWRVASFLQGSIPADASLNDYQLEGVHEAANGSTRDKPIAGTGVLFVFKIATLTVQWFLTAEETQRQFTRRTVGSGWTPWQPLSWYQGALPTGVDWDTLQAPGEWSITYLNHPNQAAPLAGTLTIHRAGSEIVQEFTPVGDNPPEYRRRLNVNGWNPWTVRVTDGGGGTGGGGSAAVDTPTRSPMGLWAPSLTTVNSAQFITEMSKDRTVGFNGNNSFGNLRETRDGGTTWTDVYTFPGAYGSVRQLDNGELLATIQNDPSPRELWLSDGYGKGGAVTWSKVLTASAPNITFIKAWSFSDYKNIVLVNEYGPKSGTAVNGYTASAGQNARYTYMSLDYGKTWKTIFDLNAYLTSVQGKTTTDNQHLHGVAWDPFWDRIWITFGDNVSGNGSTGILFSDDLGATWQAAHYYSAVASIPTRQCVGIVPMPKAVLFATDSWPNGVQRIDRAEGKKSGTYTVAQAYTINPGVQSLTHLCQAVLQVKREGGDGPVIFGFAAETASVPSHIVATYDGFTFTKLWEDSISQASGSGVRSIAGPNLQGELIVGSNDGRTANMWSKWQGPVKIY